MTDRFSFTDKAWSRTQWLPVAASLTAAMHAVYDSALFADLARVKTLASTLSGTADTPKAMQQVAAPKQDVEPIVPAEASGGFRHPPARLPEEVTQ